MMEDLKQQIKSGKLREIALAGDVEAEKKKCLLVDCRHRKKPALKAVAYHFLCHVQYRGATPQPAAG